MSDVLKIVTVHKYMLHGQWNSARHACWMVFLHRRGFCIDKQVSYDICRRCHECRNVTTVLDHGVHCSSDFRALLFLDNNGVSWTASTLDKVTAVPVRRNGNFQTPITVPAVRPKRCHTLSNPAHRQDYMVACLNYTLQTMMPLPGWPVMAPKCIRQQQQLFITVRKDKLSVAAVQKEVTVIQSRWPTVPHCKRLMLNETVYDQRHFTLA